ncbi:MAG: hypothetical protein M1167_01000 [Chloroflexi bacterium]|nr:hypothetical protein [Chloroflexota bacterium]
MDITEYVKVLLDVVVAAVITGVLYFIVRRSRREQTFVGYKARSIDEKYTGYVLLAAGIAIIVVSIYELIVLLEGNYYSPIPFGLTDIQMTVGNQTTAIASGQLLGLSFGVSFWLLIFGYGGRKLVSLGLDMLKGREVRIHRKIKTQ